MGRTRGTPKTGGRKKGTPNKVTLTMKEAIERIVKCNTIRFIDSLKDLQPLEFIKVYTNLLSYVVAKPQPITAESLAKAEYEELSALIDKSPDEFVDRIASKIVEYQMKNEQSRTQSTG